MLKTVLAAGSALAFAALAGCGGGSGRPHSDWRHPRPCAADDPDCKALPPLPPGGNPADAGSRPPSPAPSIQPQPGDIQI